MVPVKVGLGSRAVAAVSGLRPCKKAPDRLFDGKVVVLQHLITGVNLRCGLTAGGVAGIALSECLMRLVQRGVQAGGLLLRKAPGSAHVERDFDEDLERGIREDDGARIAAGSVVLEPVPAGCTVAGVPAKVVGKCACKEPAKSMDQSLPQGSG